MFGFASKVLTALNRSIVLADRFAEFDADPFTVSEWGDAVEMDESSAQGNVVPCCSRW